MQTDKQSTLFVSLSLHPPWQSQLTMSDDRDIPMVIALT